jgi:hypothetical protein
MEDIQGGIKQRLYGRSVLEGAIMITNLSAAKPAEGRWEDADSKTQRGVPPGASSDLREAVRLDETASSVLVPADLLYRRRLARNC